MESRNNINFLFSVLFLIGVIALKVKESNKRINELKKLLNDKFILINIIFIFLFSGLVLVFGKIPELMEPVKHGLLGFFIAISAKLDLVLVPFWLIFICSYYFHIG